ncbi:cell division protein ZapE [Ruicaihuangia caeni]|uniref:cell division protein ZapE n=1 Tax=Ruicaihuangia caeni TaxID=3042517 RepID=UPI00338E5350
MTLDRTTTSPRLIDRAPELSGAEMAAQLVPPRQFSHATLDNYRPDSEFPSQAEAVDAVRGFLTSWKPSGGLFSRRKAAPPKPGIYLDGGFGVGKTHLLAALWHNAPGRKYFGTFIEYTALIGALGYRDAVQLLRGATLIAIDEFELDDPGDTMMMTRLLGELVESGSRIAATSNTPPNALGEGRFAASDFLREIQSLADRFRTLRIDGHDYRRRDVQGSARVYSDSELDGIPSQQPGVVTDDSFTEVLRHLATIHPSRYVKLVDGLDGVVWRDVSVIHSQTDALRLVAFVDRLYDAQVPIFSSGVPLDQVFAPEMMSGGYRKKYLRAISRMIALTIGQDQ